MALIKIADLPDVEVDATSLSPSFGAPRVNVEEPDWAKRLTKVAELPEPTHSGAPAPGPAMPPIPTGGEQINVGMENLRTGLGEWGRSAEEGFATLPGLIRAPLRGLAELVAEVPTLPQDAAQYALFGMGPTTASMAVRNAEADIAAGHERGPMERAASALPDVAVGATPLAGPVYGIPALEEAEAGAREGDVKRVLTGLGIATLAGAGGIAEAGKLRFKSRPELPEPPPMEAPMIRGEGGPPPGYVEVQPHVFVREEAMTPLERMYAEGPEPGIEAGRPATRDAFKRALVNAGVAEKELDGLSAKQMAVKMRERGLDPALFPPTPRPTIDVPAGPTAADIADAYEPTAAEPPKPKPGAPEVPTLKPGAAALHPEYGQVKVLAEDANNVLIEFRGKYGKKRAVYVAKTSLRPLSAEELATPYEPTPAEAAAAEGRKAARKAAAKARAAEEPATPYEPTPADKARTPWQKSMENEMGTNETPRQLDIDENAPVPKWAKEAEARVRQNVKAERAAEEPSTMMESEGGDVGPAPEETPGEFGPGLESRPAVRDVIKGVVDPQTGLPVNPAENEPLPPTTRPRLTPTRENLTEAPRRNAAFDVDGKVYEMVDERTGPAQRTMAMRQAAKTPIVADFMRLIEGIAGTTANNIGNLMRRIPGSTDVAEFVHAATADLRGLTRFADPPSGVVLGRHNVKWQGGPGGWTMDPWNAARYTSEAADTGVWQNPNWFDRLTESTKAAAEPFRAARQQPPPELLARIKDELWLHEINETAVHEPLHAVHDAAHLPTGMHGQSQMVVPDRFDIVWEAARNSPEIRRSPFRDAMEAPGNMRRLRAMREFFDQEPVQAGTGPTPGAGGGPSVPPGRPPASPPPPTGGSGGPAAPQPPSPTPPGPPGGNPQLSPATKKKLSAALAGQRIGRVEANSKNIVLHAKQAAIERSWYEKAKRGEVTFVEARQRIMEEVNKINAGILDVPKAGFSAAELEQLQRQIAAKMNKDIFVWTRAANAMEKLQQGIQMEPNEFKLLYAVFGPEAMGEQPTWLRRILEQLAGLHGSLRALVTSFDVSAPGRQGLVATIGHPVLASRAFFQQMRATFSERAFQQMEEQIFNNPMRDIQKAAGLHLAQRGYGESFIQSIQLGTGEEMFPHSYAEKLPWVRGSERGYITYLNKLRSDLFNKMARTYLRRGIDFETHPYIYRDLAEAVNNMTGRGSMELFRLSPESGLGKLAGITEEWTPGRKAMEPATALLNAGFFAPRFMASRMALLRDLPLLYMNYSAPVRKMLLKDVFMTVGAGMAGLTVASQLGSKVELDPRSSDFAKVRVGKTRIDPWGGFQPWVRFMAQFATGERKSLRTGRVSPLGTAGQSDRMDLTYKFLEQKASPALSALISLARQRRATGEATEFFQKEFPYVGKDIWTRITPMVLQDFYDVANESSLELAAVTLPLGMLGMGVQTFDTTTPPTRRVTP